MKKLLILPLFLCVAYLAQAQAKFTVADQKFVAPVEVSFTNTTPTSKKPLTFAWDFGDGATSTEVSPKHRYTHSGNYTVSLTATKGKKSTTFKKMIQVTAPERCLVEIETDFGTMTVELYNSTPKHRDNFIKLAEEGYYDGTLFHRVIQGFMIQGGGFTADMNQKPTRAPVPLEATNGLKNDRGTQWLRGRRRLASPRRGLGL